MLIIRNNDKFGKLTIIKDLGIINKRSKYLCKCDCGNITQVWGSNLRKNTKSCGCLIGKNSKGISIKYKPGYIFEHSKIIERISYYKFKCICNCNKEFILSYCRMRNKRTDCGCLGNGRGKGIRTKPKKPTYLIVYRQYKSQAKIRGIDFNIDEEKFLELISLNCYYCNISPQNHSVYSGKYVYPYRYNGLDRIDSKLNYTLDNIVTCCKFCNRAKREENLELFLTWLNFVKGNTKNNNLL